MQEEQAVAEAWGAILATAKKRKFVPVLEFDVASSTEYADAKSEDLSEYGSKRRPSVQREQKYIIHHQLLAIDQLLQRKDPDHYALSYLEKLRDMWGHPGGTGISDEDNILLPFQSAIVELACVLTMEWAASLRNQPAPLGISWADYSTSIVDNSQTTFDSFGALRTCLDEALLLTELDTLPGKLKPIDAFWIYAKLMRLAAETVGSSGKSFWEGATGSSFYAKHKLKISDELAPRGIDSGWEVSESGPPKLSTRNSSTRSGTCLSHLIWLENLLRFTLLSNTRAYRTKAEIAFALSLDDQHVGIPRMPSDPFEIGLLYNRIELREIAELAELTRYCSTNEDGSPRRPGAFHLALAGLFAHFSGTDEVRSPVLIALGFDFDMEHALQEYFDAYRVLIPVYVPLKYAKGGSEMDGERRLENSTPGWAQGLFVRGENGFSAEWELVGTDTDLEHGGPLVIKLFGSPGHELPKMSDFIAGVTGHVDGEGVPIHRLVLDEMELVNSVLRNTPDEIPGLTSQMKDTMFFFFGHDALSWGDRVPYMMVTAMRGHSHTDGSEGEVAHWEPDDDDLEIASSWEPDDEAFEPGPMSKKASPSMMAIARRGDKFVESVWRRLNVAPIGDGMSLGSITAKIVGEVAKW